MMSPIKNPNSEYVHRSNTMLPGGIKPMNTYKVAPLFANLADFCRSPIGQIW